MGYIFAGVILVLTLVLPETGIGGLWNDVAMGILFIIIAIYCIYTAYHKRKDDKKAIILGIIICIFFSGIGTWNFIKVGMDVVSEPQTIQLENVTRYSFTGIRGFISQRYTIEGYDEQGNWHSFPISRSQYNLFENVSLMTITYYPHTKRIDTYDIKHKTTPLW